MKLSTVLERVFKRGIRQLREDLRLRHMLIDLLERASAQTRTWRAKLLAATWRPQFRAGILQLLDTFRESSPIQDFWALHGNSP